MIIEGDCCSCYIESGGDPEKYSEQFRATRSVELPEKDEINDGLDGVFDDGLDYGLDDGLDNDGAFGKTKSMQVASEDAASEKETNRKIEERPVNLQATLVVRTKLTSW